MSWNRPTRSALIARVRGDIDTRLAGADSRLRRNELDVLAVTEAGVADGLYATLQDNANFLPDTTDESRVLRWCAIKGIPRKAAVAAAGPASIAGTDGTLVAAGTVLVRSDGGQYLVDADVTIAAGVGTLALTAAGAGLAGAMEAAQTLTFLSPIAGVGAVATVQAPGIVGGAELESIDSLRSRLLLAFRNPVRGGAASDYEIWALQVAGVTRAWVYGNWDGLGTVKVLFVCDGREDVIPAAGDITAVAAWIEALRPVTADVTVDAPIATPLDFDIDLTPNTAEVQAAVEAALRDLISREAEPGGTLKISHVREAISLAAGETDHVLNSPSANVTPAAGHITTMGAITW
jgi:uncharacterized phage protein gp47/JayE